MAATDSAALSVTDYQQLVARIRDHVRAALPPSSTLAVVSRGDEELTRFESHHGWHFPRSLDGRYAGYHPADSGEAISHLEYLRRQGLGYFVIPSPSFWWLDYYADLRNHLESRYSAVIRNDDCIVYRVIEGDAQLADTAVGATVDGQHHPQRESTMIAELLDNLLSQGAPAAILSVPDRIDVTPPSCSPWHVTDAMAQDRRTFEDALTELLRHDVRFLVVPRAAFEWLAEHPEADRALRERHRLVTAQEHVCQVFELLRSDGVTESGRLETATGAIGSDSVGRGIWRRLGLHSLFGGNGR